MDAQADAGADAAVHHGQFPVLAVVDLAAAHEDGGAYEQVLDLTRPLVGQAAEILLETEELRAVRLRLLGRVRIVLREGVPLELVVPRLAVEDGGREQGKQRGGKDGSEA